jgi:chromosome segregation protein
MARGYQLDSSAKDANARANQSSVELERATTREIANQERIAELRTRAAAGSAELEQARLHLQGLIVERESHRLPGNSSVRSRRCPRGFAAAPGAGTRGGRSRQRRRTTAGGRTPLRHAVAYPGRACTQPDHACGRVAGALEQDAERLSAEIAAASGELTRWAQNADRFRSSSSR